MALFKSSSSNTKPDTLYYIQNAATLNFVYVTLQEIFTLLILGPHRICSVVYTGSENVIKQKQEPGNEAGTRKCIRAIQNQNMNNSMKIITPPSSQNTN